MVVVLVAVLAGIIGSILLGEIVTIIYLYHLAIYMSMAVAPEYSMPDLGPLPQFLLGARIPGPLVILLRECACRAIAAVQRSLPSHLFSLPSVRSALP